jgi:hypothetical protein
MSCYCNKKKLILTMVFSLFACLGNLMAEERPGAGSQKQRFEFAAMAGIGVDSTNTLILNLSLGWHITPVFGVEPNVAIADDVILSLNLNTNILGGRQLVPYLSAGLGVCVHGTIFFNAGGGIRIRIRDRLSLRGEVKLFSFAEEGTTTTGAAFLVGISQSF